MYLQFTPLTFIVKFGSICITFVQVLPCLVLYAACSFPACRPRASSFSASLGIDRSALSLVLRLLDLIARPGEAVCATSMSLAVVSGPRPSGPSSELFRSSVRLDDPSGNFSVLVSCWSRLQGLLLLLSLLLRAGFSSE